MGPDEDRFPSVRKIGEYAGQDVRRTQRSLDLALDGVGPSRLVETDRVLGDGAVNRPLQHHAAVHRGMLGSGTRLDQGVGVRRGQPAHVLSGLPDRVGHPRQRQRTIGRERGMPVVAQLAEGVEQRLVDGPIEVVRSEPP